MYTGNDGAKTYQESSVGLPTSQGSSPYVMAGDYALGVNIPQVLPGINSPQQLMDLLAIAQEVQAYGGIKNVLEENDALRAAELARQNNQAVTCEEEPKPVTPQFPADFQSFAGQTDYSVLSEKGTQTLIDEALAYNLIEGDTILTTDKNVAVVVMVNNGKRTVVVAPDYYEYEEDVEIEDGQAYGTQPEPAMVDPITNNVSVQIGHAGTVMDVHELVAKVVEGLTNGRRISL